MKIVYRAGNITEAEIIKGMLLSNNIEAHVSGYYLQGGIGEMAPLDLAKVHVPDKDYENARKILLEYEGNDSAQFSNQGEVENKQRPRSRRFLLTILIVIAVSILSFWIGF